MHPSDDTGDKVHLILHFPSISIIPVIAPGGSGASFSCLDDVVRSAQMLNEHSLTGFGARFHFFSIENIVQGYEIFWFLL